MLARAALVGLAALAYLALPAVALAHASFVRSEPPDLCGPLAVPRLQEGDPRCLTGVVLEQPPTAVRILFSEPVEPVGRGIRVLSPAGRPVQQGRSTADDDAISVPVDAAVPGTYVVDWQVESGDTHPVRGRFAFSVGQPSAAAAGASLDVGQVAPLGLTLQMVGRWLHFAGFALAFGTVGVNLALARWAPFELGSPRQRWRLTSAGILLLVLSEPVLLLGQTGSLGSDQMFDGDVIGDALASLFGRLMGFRLAAALLLWVIGGSLQPPLDEDAAPMSVDQRLAAFGAVGLGLAVAVIDALGQHASSFQPEALGLAVQGLHELGMAVWLASLTGVFLAWRAGKPLLLSGRVALAAFGLVAATGLAMAAVHIPAPGALVSTAYGRALTVKQLFVFGALSLAWLGLHAKNRARLWLAELTALSVTVLLASLLVSLPPPR